MGDSPVLTLREVAHYLSVHPNTVYRLAQRGQLPAFKLGSDWRFNRESIDRWRLAQEQSFAERIPRSWLSSRALAHEVFHVVYWYHAQGLNDTVAAAEIALFVESTAAAITRELNRLVQAGLLAKKKAGRETQYSLTPQGLGQARQIFGERRARAGHASVVEFELQHHARNAVRFEEKSSGPNSRTEVRN